MNRIRQSVHEPNWCEPKPVRTETGSNRNRSELNRTFTAMCGQGRCEKLPHKDNKANGKIIIPPGLEHGRFLALNQTEPMVWGFGLVWGGGYPSPVSFENGP